jgi:putative NIF3 family GTP cyclohydrolase 1 type 2
MSTMSVVSEQTEFNAVDLKSDLLITHQPLALRRTASMAESKPA